MGSAEIIAHFKPRLEAGLIAEPPSLETGDPPDPEPPQPIEHPTAVDYARWARNPDEASMMGRRR